MTEVCKLVIRKVITQIIKHDGKTKHKNTRKEKRRKNYMKSNDRIMKIFLCSYIPWILSISVPFTVVEHVGWCVLISPVPLSHPPSIPFQSSATWVQQPTWFPSSFRVPLVSHPLLVILSVHVHPGHVLIKSCSFESSDLFWDCLYVSL